MNKKIFYGIILLITLSLSLGVVSASDNFANETIGASLETPTNDIQLETSGSNSASEIKEIEKTNSNLLGLSNEDVLGNNPITPEGTNFSDIGKAIDECPDNGVIDLGNLTYTGLYNGNLISTQNKNITIQNGIIDGSKITGKILQIDYMYVTLKNIHFKNFNYIDGKRIFFFINSVLENIKFSNCSKDTYMGFFSGFSNVNATNMSFDGITSGTCVADIRSSTFKNVNFTNSKVTDDTKETDTGQFTVMNYSTLINCSFINTSSQQHAGAICMAQGKNSVINSTFINCTAWVGGAIFAHGDFEENKKFTIENCTFINCSAIEEGGALGLSHNNMDVKNCKFINNTALKGAGIMIGGINHTGAIHGDNTHGHNITVDNCYFENNNATLEGGAVHISGDNNTVTNSQFYYNEAHEGGAVHITGDNATVKDSIFDDNYAHRGKGAAVYVKGNYSSIDNSNFTRHDSEMGTVYIEGNDFNCTDSEFRENTASHGGAGIYVEGNNSYIYNSTFEKNNASKHGGAIHSIGSNARILNSKFSYNNAIPNEYDHEYGLGGAIYINGNNNKVSYSEFEYNTARNGSAIYNRGDKFELRNDTFKNNQAWSYLLNAYADPELSNYSKNNTVKVEIIHIAGDNLINAIHNDGSPDEVFFYNVTYEHSTGKKTTTSEEINPRNGVENSENGKWLYQDSREDLQVVYVDIVHNETGKVVYRNYNPDLLSYSVYGANGNKTGLYGNITVYLVGLNPGNYNVKARHPEDFLYKEISNTTKFKINPVADLAIVKEVSNKTPNFGDTIIWTLKVTNNGPNNATGVFVTDSLPAGLIYVSCDGNYDVSTHVWTIGDLAVGRTAVLKIRTIVNISNTTILNVATVDSSSYDPNKTNNVANNTTKANPVADLAIVKEVSNKTPNFGDTIIWTLKVTNNGPNDATGVFVTDSLPAGLIYVDCDGNYDVSTHVWTIGDLAVGRTAVLNIRTIVNISNTTILNVATVDSSSYDPNKTNNVANNTTKANPVADLAIVKEVSNKTPNFGDTIIWTLKVTNNGPNNATGVFVTDSLPAGLIYVDCDGNYDVNTHVWTIGDLAVGRTAVLNIRTIVNISNTTILNVATVDSSSYDPNKTNNVANNTTKANPVADLAIVKEVSNKTPNFGDTIIWTLKVTNNGPNNATGVFVTDSLPAGLIYVDCDGNYDVNTHVWTIGDLAVGRTAVLNIRTIVNISNTTILNVATVDSSSYDPNKTNNVANNTTKANPVADLAIVKEVSNKTPNFGDTIIWTLKVTNNGPNNATGVFVTDSLPAGLIYVDCDGNYDVNTHVWTIGDLAVGSTAVLNIRTIVNISNTTILNVATVDSSSYDPNKTNNVANNTTKANPIADLNVVKLVSDKTAINGDTITWTIIVKNNGPDTAVNAKAYDILPNGLIFVGSDGNYNPNTHIWTIGDLVKGASATLKIKTLVNTTSTVIVNNVHVNSSTPDSNESNNHASNDTEVLGPGLNVRKITLDNVVLVGNQVRFEIIVTNTGNTTLNNVFVEESSYTGLTYDSFVKNGYWTNSIVNGKNRWTLNMNLVPKEVIGLIVVFNTTKAGTFTNVVVAGSDETENKTAENKTKVVEGKLDVQKITLTPFVHVGNQTLFEIVVKNTGEVPLHNVVIEETSYKGLVYSSYIDTPLWTHSEVNGKNIWTLNKILNVKEVVPLIVNFNTVEVGNFTNIVTVSSNETGNKIAKNTTTVYNQTSPDPQSNKTKNPNISIEKIALDNVVILGNQALFEIIVTNTGNVVLHDVTVSEDSFTGLVYDSWYDNTGLWRENARLKWNMISPLYTGEIVSFYVVFNTTSTGNFINVVSVDSNETGKKSANDNVEVIKPDFAVEKIALNRSVMVGEQVMFEIVVHNLGQVDLTNVVVREDSFSGLIYDSFTDYTGLWTKNSDLSWTLNTPLRAGEYAGFFVTFNTTAEGKFVNVVVADSNEIPNKTDNDTVEVLNPSLDVQKITINRTVNVGEQVMFEIVVHNSGKVILNDVTVRENSFDGLTYDSFIDNYGLWTKNGDLSWTLNTPLYAGEYLSFFVVFNTNNAGTFTNVVSASSDKTKDKPATNTTTVIENPKTPMADLVIVKGIYAIDGNKVTWGLYVVNNGPDKAVNARVIDALPKTLKYVSSVATKGNYDVNTGIWTIGDMENGEKAVMILETIVLTTGDITNEAIVTSDTFDPDMSNNYDNETVFVSPIPETPQQPKENVEPVDVTPATGNPLVMVLLALIALGTATFRRRK